MNQLKHSTWTLRKAPTGPLISHLDGYCSWLHEQGFCRPYIGRQIRQVAQFSCWLSCNDMVIGDITDCLIGQFFEKKNRRRLINQGEHASLSRFMKYLDQVGIALPKPSLLPLTPIEVSLNDFGSYLLSERELSPKTLIQYRPTIEKFLVFKFGCSKIDLNLVVGADIIQFVQAEANKLSTVRGKVVVNAIRAFLRYGMHRYQLSPSLLSAVPKVASWSQPGIIKAISHEDIEKLLLSCDRHTLPGVRDFAVLKYGANLMEIGSILRHEQAKTTNLYAKVNIDSLRSLSPAWPGSEL